MIPIYTSEQRKFDFHYIGFNHTYWQKKIIPIVTKWSFLQMPFKMKALLITTCLRLEPTGAISLKILGEKRSSNSTITIQQNKLEQSRNWRRL